MAIITQSAQVRKDYCAEEHVFLMDSIGERLRHFAKTRYKTMTAFASAVGLKPASLTYYLNNQRVPGGEVLERFRQAGVSVDWLLSGEGEMEAKPRKAIELDGGDIAIIHGDMTLSELADWYISQQKEKPKKATHEHDDEGDEEPVR